jgi:oligoendopeptidase F
MLKSGGSDYPMAQLRAAGVDLRDPGPIQAVVDELDRRVTQLEAEIARLGTPSA